MSVSNITKFTSSFFRAHGSLDVYQNYLQGALDDLVTWCTLYAPNSQRYFIDKMVHDAIIESDSPVELEIEWCSTVNQQTLTRIVELKGRPLAVPKRSRTCYELFCQENREEVEDYLDTRKASVVNKELAKRWHACDQSPYGDLAEFDKARFKAKKGRYSMC